MPTYLPNDVYAKFAGENLLEPLRQEYQDRIAALTAPTDTTDFTGANLAPPDMATGGSMPVSPTPAEPTQGVPPAPSAPPAASSPSVLDTPIPDVGQPVQSVSAAQVQRGQQYSPFDSVFAAHAGDLAQDPTFLAIVAAGTKAESGWNTNSTSGDGGHSWGLFQMHDAGAGAGMGNARLDPNAASAVMVPRYAAAYKQALQQYPGLTGAALASYVAAQAERPQGYDDPNSAARRNYAAAFEQVTGGAGAELPSYGGGPPPQAQGTTGALPQPRQSSPLEAMSNDFKQRLTSITTPVAQARDQAASSLETMSNDFKQRLGDLLGGAANAVGGALPEAKVPQPEPGSPLARSMAGTQLSPIEQLQAGAQTFGGATEARRQNVTQLLGPAANVPGVAGLAQAITDPLILTGPSSYLGATAAGEVARQGVAAFGGDQTAQGVAEGVGMLAGGVAGPKVAGLLSRGAGAGAAKALEAADTIKPPQPVYASTTAPEAVPAATSVLDETLAMFQRADQRPSLATRVRGALSQAPAVLERQVADRFADINRLAGPEAEIQVANFQGRGGAVQMLTDEAFAPVYTTLGHDRGLIDATNAFRKFQRDIEVATLKGAPRKFSGGVQSAADAQAALGALEQRLGPEAWAKVQQADQQTQTVLDSLLHDKVAAGMIDANLAEQLLAEQPHYNPTRLQEVLDATGGRITGTGKQLNQTDNLLRRLGETGSEADTVPSLQAAISAYVQGRMAILRNDAVRTIVQGLKANPETRKGIVKVPTSEIVRGASLESPGAQGAVAKRVYGDIPGALSYWEGGKRVAYAVPPEIERQAKALDSTTLNAAVRLFQRIGQTLNAPTRLGAVTLNPAFLATNAVADALTTYFREGLGTTLHIPQGYVQALFQTRTYRDFVKAGGSMESYFMRSPSAAEQAIIAHSGGMLVHGPASLRRVLGLANPVGAIQRVGGAIEMGPRLATYSAHLRAGESVGAATLAGRRVTVDFARGGDAVKLANSWALFLNARIQGALNIPRTMGFNRPSGILKPTSKELAARFRLAGLTALAVGTYAWNRQFPEYADVPQYVKDQYAVVMLPGSEKDPSGPGYSKLHYLALPLRELAAFTMPALKVLQLADEQAPDKRSLDTFLQGWANVALPMAGSDAASTTAGLLPVPMKLPMEVGYNRRFYSGTPIVSSRFENTVPSAQFDEHTSELAKRLGEQYGISPKGLDFVVSEVLGGAGRLALQAGDQAMGKPVEGVPVLSGVTSGVLRTYGGQIQESQYQQLGKAIDARQEDLARQVRQLPEYQRATPDAQQAMLKYARERMVAELKAQGGILPIKRETGAPPKYRGVSDYQQQVQIDRAISKYTAWERDRRGNPQPSREEMLLARRYQDRISPLWTRFNRQQDRTRGPLRVLGDQFAAPVPTGAPLPAR